MTLSAFLISAAFLLTGVTFAPDGVPVSAAAPDTAAPPVGPGVPVRDMPRIPYERESRIFFLDGSQVAAVRAEGHYTIIYHRAEKLFCPWSISEAERRLSPGFLRAHRSYLINPRLVTGFERLKDTGICHFDGCDPPVRVPVSRSFLGAVREALGL